MAATSSKGRLHSEVLKVKILCGFREATQSKTMKEWEWALLGKCCQENSDGWRGWTMPRTEAESRHETLAGLELTM